MKEKTIDFPEVTETSQWKAEPSLQFPFFLHLVIELPQQKRQ
jgi:hypothetical protein